MGPLGPAETQGGQGPGKPHPLGRRAGPGEPPRVEGPRAEQFSWSLPEAACFPPSSDVMPVSSGGSLACPAVTSDTPRSRPVALSCRPSGAERGPWGWRLQRGDRVLEGGGHGWAGCPLGRERARPWRPSGQRPSCCCPPLSARHGEGVLLPLTTDSAVCPGMVVARGRLWGWRAVPAAGPARPGEAALLCASPAPLGHLERDPGGTSARLLGFHSGARRAAGRPGVQVAFGFRGRRGRFLDSKTEAPRSLTTFFSFPPNLCRPRRSLGSTPAPAGPDNSHPRPQRRRPACTPPRRVGAGSPAPSSTERGSRSPCSSAAHFFSRGCAEGPRCCLTCGLIPPCERHRERGSPWGFAHVALRGELSWGYARQDAGKGVFTVTTRGRAAFHEPCPVMPASSQEPVGPGPGRASTCAIVVTSVAVGKSAVGKVLSVRV